MSKFFVLVVALAVALATGPISFGAEKRWIEKDGVVYLTVKSDGTTGPQWINRLEERGFLVRYDNGNTDILNSPTFKPTSRVVYKVVVLKGEPSDITAEAAFDRAKKMGLVRPPIEVACLIREKISDKDMKKMGFWSIYVLHEPVKNVSGNGLERILSPNVGGVGDRLVPCPVIRLGGEGNGFAFVMP